MAITPAGSDGSAAFNLGVSMWRMGRLQEAGKAFEQAAIASPSEAVVARTHGEIRLRTMPCSRACDPAVHCEASDHGIPSGEMLEEVGEHAAAEAVYRAAVTRGVWQHWQQRAPHIATASGVHRLLAQRWHWPPTGQARSGPSAGAAVPRYSKGGSGCLGWG